ncbi:MAG UNVERIFIED_CONTAM: hypothetical protein LVR18_03635 [Planctomycetaceae bacterium]
MADTIETKAIVKEETKTCSIIAPSCVSSEVSQSVFNFSGPAVQCLTETLRTMFFNPQAGCVGTNVNMSSLGSFALFQESLKIAVRALLILYVMGYGIKLLMNESEFNLESAVKFIMKVILVGYFAVGWGPAYFTQGVKTTSNGTLEWGLPILTQLTSDLASMTFAAGNGGRGLCEFKQEYYPKNYGYFGLWDRIDCKLGAYLLFKKVYGFGVLGVSNFNDGYREITTDYRQDVLQDDNRTQSAKQKAVSGIAQIGLFVIILGFLLGGGFLSFMALLYPMIIILVLILGFVSLYTVCLVTLHVLIYLSPIFVPLVLLREPKVISTLGSESLLSCALQPMVMAAFMAFMLNMFDDVIFGSCIFQRHDFRNGDRFFTTFDILLPKENATACVISSRIYPNKLPTRRRVGRLWSYHNDN